MLLPKPCSNCKRKKSYAFRYKDGVYLCGDCTHISANNYVSIQQSQRIRTQRENHAKDLIQPYKGDNINSDFVRHYPEQSKEMFHPKELAKVHNGSKGKAKSRDDHPIKTNPI